MNNDFQIENGVLIKYRGSSRDVIIPDEVTSIGAEAFSDCSNLTSIHIPKGVTSIGNYAFEGCSSLTSVFIPESATSIGHSAFSGCSSLTSIHIPEGVTSIGHSTFSGCSNLTSIHIPEGVTNIEYWAFSSCPNLTGIHIPECVIGVNKTAFEGCQNLKVTYRGFTFRPDISGKISVCEIADMIEKRDFSVEMLPWVKYSVIWNVFCINPQNKEALALIKKGFQRMFKFLIDENDIQTIQKVLASTDFVTKKNIDKLIPYAIDNQKHEIQVMLTNHKAQKGWYEDSEKAINKKFKL